MVEGNAPVEPPAVTRTPAPGEAADKMRGYLAIAVLAIFAITILLSFYALLKGPGQWANAKQLLEVVLPIETGILGTALGYYFGSRGNA